MFLLLVCGGRKFNDATYLFEQLDLARTHYGELFIIQGGAPGADRMAEDWAKARGVHGARVEALWDFYGRYKAGPLRNGAMLVFRPQAVLAFAGGTGTANMCKQAAEAGIPVYAL